MALSKPTLLVGPTFVQTSGTSVNLTIPSGLTAGTTLFVFGALGSTTQEVLGLSGTAISNGSYYKLESSVSDISHKFYIIHIESDEQYANTTVTFSSAAAGMKVGGLMVLDVAYPKVWLTNTSSGTAAYVAPAVSTALRVTGGYPFYITYARASDQPNAQTFTELAANTILGQVSTTGDWNCMAMAVGVKDTDPVQTAAFSAAGDTIGPGQSMFTTLSINVSPKGGYNPDNIELVNLNTFDPAVTGSVVTEPATPISFVAASGLTATADTSNPFGNLTGSIPSGTTTGDLMFLFYGGKPYTTAPTSTPANWTNMGTLTSGTNTPNTDYGSMRGGAYVHTHSGSESNPVLTFDAEYNPGMVGMITLRKSSGTQWQVGAAGGVDSDQTGTRFRAVATDYNRFDVKVGDWIVAAFVSPSDTGVPAYPTLYVPGCSLVEQTQRLTTTTTTTGLQGCMAVYTARVAEGTPTGPPVFGGVGNLYPEGTVIFLKVTIGEPATGVTVSPTPAAAGDVTQGSETWYGDAALTITHAPAAAGYVTDFGVATGVTVVRTAAAAGYVASTRATTGVTVTSTTAAAGTTTKPIVATGVTVVRTVAAAGFVTDTGTATGVTVTRTTAAAGYVTDLGTASLTVTPVTTAVPQAITDTTTADLAISPATAGALGAVTKAAPATGVTVGRTTAATGGLILVTSAIGVTVTRSTSAAGYVTDSGTVSVTIAPTTAAAGFVTDTGTASLTISPTPAATPQALTKTQAATGVTVSSTTAATPQALTRLIATALAIAPSSSSAGVAWATKFLRPDALLVQTGVTGVVANIQDSPTSPDGSALVPSGGAIDVRMSFEDNAQDMRTGTGDQIIRVRVTAV